MSETLILGRWESNPPHWPRPTYCSSNDARRKKYATTIVAYYNCCCHQHIYFHHHYPLLLSHIVVHFKQKEIKEILRTKGANRSSPHSSLAQSPWWSRSRFMCHVFLWHTTLKIQPRNLVHWPFIRDIAKINVQCSQFLQLIDRD